MVSMSKKEIKYYVLKHDDIENYITPIGRETLKECAEAIPKDNKYWVVNQDEPYADPIIQIILMGEDQKKLKQLTGEE